MFRYRSAAVLFVVLLNAACTIKTGGKGKGSSDDDLAAAPSSPPTVTSATPPPAATVIPPPPATTSAAPVVAATAAAPAPVKTVFVQAPAPVSTAASCKKTFTSECTIKCNTKVNASTSDPNKRRIEHDICFGECTRSAEKYCGN